MQNLKKLDFAVFTEWLGDLNCTALGLPTQKKQDAPETFNLHRGRVCVFCFIVEGISPDSSAAPLQQDSVFIQLKPAELKINQQT